ncbi:hypothetical protein GCM10022221_35480 [Actinocorallia aurea]
MAVGTLGRQLDTDTEDVDAQDPHLDDTPDQVRAELSPLSRRKFMYVSYVSYVSTFYHGAWNHSLDIVSRLNRSICP